ncbi:nitrate- and nitrite sensing domain-containing protein [Streptomyces chitinivorans]|uniref:histidine kinase n=1 Tax=Streptomyces chitinivorans TaxID=1257027 RepID=A0ABW7HYW7_9ACTN|nr:nitrate- and nitrite sensing domain-containing protein [Streptomyces chitinivorans]MDH2411603.1 nitrate- and nitrite sensing domain-containing protein [Streptomyces chitinivorans]
MALRTRVPRRQGRSASKTFRLISLRPKSIRAALLVLAVVPSLAMIALWGVSTGQWARDWEVQKDEKTLAARAGTPANAVYFNLQEERRLSAEMLAGPDASTRGALREQRARTDEALRAFRSLSGIEASNASEELREIVELTRSDMLRIDRIRQSVDNGVASQADVFRYFTELIAVDLRLFETLSRSENSEVTARARVLIDLFWAKEMLSREDALLARGWDSGRLTNGEHSSLTEWIGAQQFLLESRIAPHLPHEDLLLYRQMTTNSHWLGKAETERVLLGAHSHEGEPGIPLPDSETEWRKSVDALTPQFQKLIMNRTIDINQVGGEAVAALERRMTVVAAISLVAILLIVTLSLRIAGALRRRITSLRQEALELEGKLPDVVERLRRGETVDTEAEMPRVGHERDELGRLGQALNLAGRSAVETAVREVEQHRGFERLLQRIARRTQLLIGLQMKKLDEMERRHEDPEVLEGLFDLDHLTARLRRYEENLVILGGGQPQRRWRKPVKVLDVLRAALGEVQDYRRIQVEVEGRPWLTGRAVGPVVHVLAELMENAAAFSKPPTPVEVRAGMVGRGLVVEIEDRGLGMEPDEYERVNRLIADPPRTDMLSRADDVRLGLYVVARLASGLGLGVEFRPSVFGGTRVIVHIPEELVADRPADDAPRRASARRGAAAGSESADGRENVPFDDGPPAPLPVRSRGRAMSAVVPSPADPPSAEGTGTARGTGTAGGTKDAEEARHDGTGAAGDAEKDTGRGAETAAEHPADTAGKPLPKRVRQASLAPELRKPAVRKAPVPDEDTLTLRPEPARSGAAIGAFQRQSRIARQQAADPDAPSTTGGSTPGQSRPKTEDRT